MYHFIGMPQSRIPIDTQTHWFNSFCPGLGYQVAPLTLRS